MGWKAPSPQVRKPYSNAKVPEDLSVWYDMQKGMNIDKAPLA